MDTVNGSDAAMLSHHSTAWSESCLSLLSTFMTRTLDVSLSESVLSQHCVRSDGTATDVAFGD